MDVDFVDIVFDGPPGPESGRFVEVENSQGKSISFGEWKVRADGCWVLRIPNLGGCIGESTRNEIDYATANGKPVDYLESIA